MIETDYLVVGAGASGMAFVDSVLANSDARVILVDRRHRPGGHWLDAVARIREPAITDAFTRMASNVGAAMTNLVARVATNG